MGKGTIWEGGTIGKGGNDLGRVIGLRVIGEGPIREGEFRGGHWEGEGGEGHHSLRRKTKGNIEMGGGVCHN